MNVSLTPKLDEFVSSKVSSGRYTSASEVIREALRLLEEHDIDRNAKLEAFNRELGRRIELLDKGVWAEPSAVRARLRRKSEERPKRNA